MKQLNYLGLFASLLFVVSCGQDKTKAKSESIKEEPLGITIPSHQEVESNEPYIGVASYDASFEDEYRDGSSNGAVSFNANMDVTYSITSNGTTSSNQVAIKNDQSQAKRQKKIIKNGAMRIKTKHFNESKKEIDEILTQLNGYYESEELDKNEERISYDLTIRVPTKNFEALVKKISGGKDEILFKKVNATNVTEEFLDIQTRLENKRNYLKRYKDLLSKAKSVNEILNIEENIRQLMEEIESKEGRLKYLNDQVDLSTLHVVLFKEYPVKEPKEIKTPISSKAGSSLAKGWYSIVNFCLWVISKWPMIILLGVLAWYIRKRWRKRKLAGE